jgi:general secretion pathway protein G
VIVIIGLLAAYVGPKYFAQLGKSEVTVARAQIGAFEKALDTYRLDMGRYPTTQEGLDALVGAPTSGESRWNGPYLKNVPLDPWGKKYEYKTPGTNAEYDIVSPGLSSQASGAGQAEANSAK